MLIVRIPLFRVYETKKLIFVSPFLNFLEKLTETILSSKNKQLNFKNIIKKNLIQTKYNIKFKTTKDRRFGQFWIKFTSKIVH